VTIDAGAERDPLAKAGIGALTNAALAEGTHRLSGDELADAFERLGGTLDVEQIWTRAECSTTVLAPHFAEALRLLAEVTRSPAFPESEVNRLRDERLAELLQQQAEPRGLADDMFARFVFSAESRYSLPEAGDEATVRELSRADVEAHYLARYGPRGASLIVAGDVEPETVFQLAEEVFGDWERTPSAAPRIISEAAHAERRVHLVAKGDAPQSELRIGHTTLPRRHPDFYPVAVMNGVLGGLFNSRINLNLREAHAYTYGAFSVFDWRRLASAFEVSTAVRSDVTAAAVHEILSEIDRIREGGVSESELSLARDYMTGVFPIRFESTQAIADAIAMREAFELEPDYYDTYRDRIAEVSADDVLAVARRHLEPSRLQIVAVCDPAAVEESLAALDVGPVSVYSANGALAR
jgi:zinc protease